jgi:hypothetical protein
MFEQLLDAVPKNPMTNESSCVLPEPSQLFDFRSTRLAAREKAKLLAEGVFR